MLRMNVLLTAVTLAAGGAVAGAASAATVYDFRTALPNAYTEPLRIDNFTVSVNATGVGNEDSDVLTQSGLGLGVRGEGFLDIDFGVIDDQFRIDGKPAGSTESITLTFDFAVNLDNFVLSSFDSNDDYGYSINGGAAVFSTLAFNALDASSVTSFSIFAAGSLGQDGLLGNDEFGLESIQVSAVPVPATLGLLGAALAGLGLLRRRRSAA